jgi:hypothetical protein
LARDDKDHEHDLLGDLPAYERDCEWVSREEEFLQDTDVLMVFRAEPGGETVVPEDDVLAPSQWFTNLENMPARCLNSAHDRSEEEVSLTRLSGRFRCVTAARGLRVSVRTVRG